MKFGIQYGYFGGKINVGNLNKYGTEFLNKEDLTGPAIWAVAEWLEARDEGYPYEIFKSQGGSGYRLTVERIECV